MEVVDVFSPRRTLVAIAAALAVAAAGVPAAADSPQHDVAYRTIVNPKDGTEIAITIFKPAVVHGEGRSVPVVLHSHGWAGSRKKAIDDEARAYLNAGMAMVSIDQRGHGDSTGLAHVQDPTKETEDIEAVIDYIADLGWIRLDAPGDPVMGAIGGSYGGGYQTMTALDEIYETGRTRFDALAPQITWFDLPESLAPQKTPRSAWNTVLYAAGASNVPQYIHEGFVWGAATAQWPDGTIYGNKAPGVPNLHDEFYSHSPAWFEQRGHRIDVPVLIRQGTSDNLFNLNQGLKIFERALTPGAREQSYFIAFNGGHALPNAMPPGEPMEAQLGGGADACNKDFTRTTIEFFQRVFAGASTKGLYPERYNLTNLEGDRCLRADALGDPRTVKVDPLGTGTIVTPNGAGAPLQLEVAEGPLTVTGVPRLEGKLTAPGIDSRAFFGLAVGSTPVDARVVQNNLMPLRRLERQDGERFEMELPGVVVEVPKGENLYLTVAPFSDMYYGHTSRTGLAMVLSDLKLSLPRPLDRPAGIPVGEGKKNCGRKKHNRPPCGRGRP